MKNILLFLLMMVMGFSSVAQKYIARTGHIGFYSKSPVENIAAHNHQASGVLDKENGQLAFSVLMKGFLFEKALMQEHFNENYVESDKYPKASFKGKIIDFNKEMLNKSQPVNVKVEGEMNLHGIARNIIVDGELSTQDDKILAKSTFSLKIADYNIKIPKAVINNIAETIDVTVDFSLEPLVQ